MSPVGRWVWVSLTLKSPQLPALMGDGLLQAMSHLCCPEHAPWSGDHPGAFPLCQGLLTHPGCSRGSPVPSACPSCHLQTVRSMHPCSTQSPQVGALELPPHQPPPPQLVSQEASHPLSPSSLPSLPSLLPPSFLPFFLLSPSSPSAPPFFPSSSPYSSLLPSSSSSSLTFLLFLTPPPSLLSSLSLPLLPPSSSPALPSSHPPSLPPPPTPLP